MKTQHIDKREYKMPQIIEIKLDNEISLVLDSTPTPGPGEGSVGSLAPEFMNSDPFKTYMG